MTHPFLQNLQYLTHGGQFRKHFPQARLLSTPTCQALQFWLLWVRCINSEKAKCLW
jgi:hypothetical protein